jgi:hypothetical protein
VCLFYDFALPATSRISVADTSVMPQLTNGAVSGWMYLNLDHDQTDALAHQNWVVVSMRAEGRYSVDLDAAAMGNGCSAAAGTSEHSRGTVVVGPAPNR